MSRVSRPQLRRNLPFLLSLAVLYLLGWRLFPRGGDGFQAVLGSIGEALEAGLNWGRQCLVGSIRYPLLPVLGRMLCRHAGPLGRTLAFLPAFGCLSFPCRWHFAHRQPGRLSIADAAAAAPGVLFLLLMARRGGFVLGIEAYLLAGFLFHILRCHERDGHLGDLVMAAFHLGGLVFCGALAIVCSALLLGAALRLLLPAGRVPEGVRLNLCLPYLYGILLVILLNRLVMGDAWFYFRECHHWAAGYTWQDFLLKKDAIAGILALDLPGLAFPILILADPRRRTRRAAGLLLAACGLLAAKDILRTVMGFQTDHLQAMCLLLEAWSAGILALRLQGRNAPVRKTLACLAALACPAALACQGSLRPRPETPPAFRQGTGIDLPELETYIDRHWQDSRVVVLGDRLPAEIGDLTERRYVARLDFQPSEILKQADDEQLHLLMPPPDAGYYPPGDPTMRSLYLSGAPWLFLERKSPGGWLLYRVVPPPKGESRLEKLLSPDP